MLFSNNKKRKVAAQNEAQDKVANVAHYFILWKTKWAAWMQRKTELLSVKGKFMVLILFCLLAGGYNIYIAASSFSGKRSLPFSISSIKQPEYIRQPDARNLRNPISISEEEYQGIRRFKLYMDSLAHSPSGQKIFDSIITARPGLMDSVLIIENMYQSRN